MPTTSIDAEKVEFNLERYDAANVYQIQNTYIEARIKIVKEDGSTLPTKTVGPINNVLHSLFSSVRLTVNDTPITVNDSDYPYKAYITNLMTYPITCKSSQLIIQGWDSDLNGFFDDVTSSNAGFTNRTAYLKQGNAFENSYRPDGALYFGR